MKRTSILILILILLASFWASGCSEKGSESANAAPSITGAADQTIKAGTEFDALSGLTASDPEDGDLTAMILIDSTPALDFKNGKVTPENAGTYEITYSVTDKGGLTAEAYATLTVTRKTGDATTYKPFDFSTQPVPESHGWEAKISDEAAAEAGLEDGAYVFDIASPGAGDGDVQLSKANFALNPADYRIKVWAKSTKPTYAHLIARDESKEEWATFGGVFNAEIGTEIAPIELTFTSEAAGSAELLLNLGKITPNPDQPDETTPEEFLVTIDKIEIYEISGEETRTAMFSDDFKKSDGVIVEAGDGASASATSDDDVTSIVIEKYPTDGGVWSVKAAISLGDLEIQSGEKYYYRLTVNSEYAQSGEALVESAAKYDANRVHFAGVSLEPGEETTLSGSFIADQLIEDPVIRLQIGNPSDAVEANTIILRELEFGKVEGDLETKKTIDSFSAFGRNTANGTNSDYPWETFNGTDEDNEKGVGTIWTKDGTLYYRIDQGGVADWHNKLILGYAGNPLTLESDSYYLLEFTAKADKEISGSVFLNTLGGWDPRISEGITLSPEPQTFQFETLEPFITDMDFELLFQFGSDETAALGAVTVEISDFTIYQRKIE